MKKHYLLIFLALACLCLAAPHQVLPAENAGQIMDKVYEKTLSVNNFQADIIILKQDPYYLDRFFPETRNQPGTVPFKGKVSFYKPNYFNLMFETPDKKIMSLFSMDGVGLVLREQFSTVYPAGFQPGVTPTPTASPGATSTPSPTESGPSPSSPSPTVSESTSVYNFTPSSSLSASPGSTEAPGTPMSFSGDVTQDMHALALAFPFCLKMRTPEDYADIIGSEKIYDEDCYVLNVGSTIRGEFTIWVNKKTYYINKIRYFDPGNNKEVDGYFKNFNEFTKDGKTFYFFQAMEVSVDGKMVVEAELTNFEINIPTKDIFGYVDPSLVWKFGEAKGRFVPRLLIKREETPLEKVRFLSTPLSIIVIILLSALVYFIYRYMKFVLSRKPFSQEIIVIESSEGKALSKALTAMRVPVVPFSVELISEERNLLERKKGQELPRVVIIENQASSTIKKDLYLLKAYVEEGGRVIVLPHGMESITSMPVAPNFMPLKKFDEDISFTIKPSIWKRTKIAELEKNIFPFSPDHIYFTVNNKPVDVPMITTYHRQTGARGTLVGICKEGKGEYLLCQLDILKSLESQYVVTLARAVFIDIIKFMQYREHVEKEKPQDITPKKSAGKISRSA
ncbi:MAG: hypothetical protein RDV48_13195 [Candidatus Eremiobacteraeota bacterium]|nr:hypothetical protein [Candidatus Eremiobacteraeota bacterium]